MYYYHCFLFLKFMLTEILKFKKVLHSFHFLYFCFFIKKMECSVIPIKSKCMQRRIKLLPLLSLKKKIAFLWSVGKYNLLQINKSKKMNERLMRELESCKEMVKAKDKTIEVLIEYFFIFRDWCLNFNFSFWFSFHHIR